MTENQVRGYLPRMHRETRGTAGDNRERAFSVCKSGKNIVEGKTFTGEKNSVLDETSCLFPNGLLAFHTHVRNAGLIPSPQDVEFAFKGGYEVFCIGTPHGKKSIVQCWSPLAFEKRNVLDLGHFNDLRFKEQFINEKEVREEARAELQQWVLDSFAEVKIEGDRNPLFTKIFRDNDG